jgi:hypothetical protein
MYRRDNVNLILTVLTLTNNPEKKRKGDNNIATNVISGNLEVEGIVRATAFLQFSDLRLKTDIEELTDAINIVASLQGKTYYWKSGITSEEKGGKRVIGLIAQEVQRVLPEVLFFCVQL